MTTDEREQILARRKELPLLNEERQSNWDDEPPGHLLHYFRPDGVGLEEIVAGMDHADDVLAGLRQVFAATSNSKSGDMYFIVRKAPRLRAAELETLARRHIANVIEMAKLVSKGDRTFAREHREDIATLSAADLAVEVVPGVPPTFDHRDVHPLHSFLYETTTSFGHLYPPASEHAELLAEPCYMLAELVQELDKPRARERLGAWPRTQPQRSPSAASPGMRSVNRIRIVG